MKPPDARPGRVTRDRAGFSLAAASMTRARTMLYWALFVAFVLVFALQWSRKGF